ncbi:MAG TPA: HAD family hydrolase [Bryobacteraceae bacterium]|jgi:HAD superfamily hydrolase (TIGR01484 family)|nr:HAD family hydrolase [Bryobacteraceae bacterium]
MRYGAFATDYDGTLAAAAIVANDTYRALEQLKRRGWRLILVTGRQVPDLMHVFPELDIFDLIVAENGAILFNPSSGQQVLLCDPIPDRFVHVLQTKNVTPLSQGQVIVATTRDHEQIVLHTMQELGMHLQITLNKGNLMLLPAGIDKATGLAAALGRLELSFDQTVGVGDAENDLAFFSKCGLAVAVGNALPSLKGHADLVMTGEDGSGVVELIHELLLEEHI